MKIAFVTNSIFETEGQGRVSCEIIRHCALRGVAMTLVASRVAPSVLSLPNVHWEQVHPFVQRPALALVWDFARRADAVINRLRGSVDTVVANGVSLRCSHDVNICHFVHAAWMRSPANPYKEGGGLYGWYQRTYVRQNSFWEMQTYGSARHIVAVSDMTRGDLIRAGVTADRISVIGNGVDLNEYHPAREDRAVCGLPAAVPLALFAGDLRTSRKNLDTVLAALAQVPALHLAVAGRHESSPYPQLAASLGVADRVHFLGFQGRVGRLMRSCDFFIFPSRYDPCPLVVLEALASGLPVITSRATGSSNAVDEESGFVIDDSNDVERCAQAMRALASDQPLRARMSAGARLSAEKRGWDTVASQYLNLFEELSKAPLKAAV
jgi:glycosyltransferase involved in cell wall biosynthesis